MIRLLMPFTEPVIEPAVAADIPVLADIHAASFANDWSEDEIAALMSGAGVTATVARRRLPFGTRRPVGFLLTRTVVDEAEILTLAVTPAWRSLGIGRDLVRHGLRSLAHAGVASVFLEVDADNAAARRLYEGVGFRQVGLRRGYYSASPGAGTALVLRRDLR